MGMSNAHPASTNHVAMYIGLREYLNIPLVLKPAFDPNAFDQPSAMVAAKAIQKPINNSKVARRLAGENGGNPTCQRCKADDTISPYTTIRKRVMKIRLFHCWFSGGGQN